MQQILFNPDEVASLLLGHAIGISLMAGMIAAYEL